MINKTLIALRSFVVSIGATAASSFVGVYSIYLGATAVIMGWLQSSSTGLTNAGQFFWGRLSDRVGMRKPFLTIGSVILAFLWFLMARIRSPIDLVIVYALISFFASLITVNWFSLIADQTESSVRGKFLSVINNLSSTGTIISLILMTFFFSGQVTTQIEIPFFAAVSSYIISSVLMLSIKETRVPKREKREATYTLRHMKEHPIFRRYFIATNVQGLFWSMAWPLFPITIVSVMHFTLAVVAYLTVGSLLATVMLQLFLGRITDKVTRPPLIFVNRIALSMIPLMYGFFTNFSEFMIMEVYSGLIGAISNVVTNAYLLDIIPSDQKAEFISIINGFNGVVFLIGALAGGYMLAFMETIFSVYTALFYSYIIIFAGRLLSSLLFIGMKEPQQKGRTPLGIYSLLFRQKNPGNPSGGTMRFR